MERLLRRRLRASVAIVLSLALSMLGLTAASALGAQSPRQANSSALAVGSLTTDDIANPLGISDSQPQLAWVINSAARGVAQASYQIRVATSEQALVAGQNLIWDSGVVKSAQSFNIAYSGPALSSRTRYYWQVRVRDNYGTASGWSAPAWFETAFLDPSQFQGDWIGDPDPLSLTGSNWIWYPEGSPASSAPVATRYFLRQVTIPANENLARASFLITADDQWLAYVNGQEVGESSGQANAWTQAQQLDISSELHAGTNTIAVAATNAGGPGSWIGTISLEYADGTTSTVITDSSWQSSQTDPAGWQDPGFDDSSWPAALSVDPYGSGPWGTSVSVGSELLLRKSFTLQREPISSARLYVSGLSYPYMYVDGRSVSNDKLATAFTDYSKTVDYSTYDVTKLLHSANNELAVSLGDGFYASGADDYPTSGEPWQSAQPELKLELVVKYANGTSSEVVSDPSWQIATGPTAYNSPASEEYDAYQEKPGWEQGSGAAGWVNAGSLSAPSGTLQAAMIPAVQVTGTVKPVSVTEPIADTDVYTFPITTSGWASITMQGVPGTTVSVQYSEKLNSDGTVNTEGNGQAGQIDSYTFNSASPVTFVPKYGWKGYEYVSVSTNSCPSGVAAPCTQAMPKILNITGVIAHTNLATSGNFTSSSKLLNEMHTAQVNTILNNQYSYGSDTPTYEKGGWTNDNGDYSTSELANFDAEAYYTHMMQNFDDSQDSAGNIGVLVPTPPGDDNVDPLWGGSFLLIEYNMYENYDDLSVIRRDYSHMAAYINDLESIIEPTGYIYQGTTYGDWSVPSNDPNPPSSQMLGSMFLYRETEDLSIMAAAIGNTSGASEYASLASSIRTAVNNEFYDAADQQYIDPVGLDSHAYGGPNGVITSTAYDQTANVYGLAFGLAPSGDEQAIAAGLAANVTADGNHLATGANGSKYILPMLTDYGYGDLAYLVATNPTAPGWGQWFLQCGATTMWEAWEDSSCDTARSHDHAFMGTVDDWLFENVAGIQSTSAAFRTLSIDPSAVSGLSYASAYETTPLGRVGSSWTLHGTSFALTIQVPVGSRASVCVPTTSAQSVTESGNPVADASGVTVVGMQDSCLQVRVGSGTYRFHSTLS
jgi:alpha-L-rhamnosidase